MHYTHERDKHADCQRGYICTVHPMTMPMVLLCFVLFWFVYYQFLKDSCLPFVHILQGCFTGTGAIIWLPLCQWSNSEGYGQKNDQYQTTKKAQQSMNHMHECHNSWDALYWQDLWEPLGGLDNYNECLHQTSGIFLILSQIFNCKVG